MPKLRNSNDSAIVAMENIFQMMFLSLWLNSRFGGWPTARLAPHDGASLTNYNKSGGHQEAAEPNCQQRITESRRAAEQQTAHSAMLSKAATTTDSLKLLAMVYTFIDPEASIRLLESLWNGSIFYLHAISLKVDAMDRNIQDSTWIQRTTAFIYFIYFYIFVFWG